MPAEQQTSTDRPALLSDIVRIFNESVQGLVAQQQAAQEKARQTWYDNFMVKADKMMDEQAALAKKTTELVGQAADGIRQLAESNGTMRWLTIVITVATVINAFAAFAMLYRH